MNQSYCLSADIGGTSIKLAVISLDGIIVKKWEIPTDKQDQGINIPRNIHDAFEKELTKMEVHNDQILGIGAGAPGFINTETGFIYEAVNIGWKNFNLGEQLQELSGFPVWVDNDANLAALGENWLGAGEGSDYLIAVTLGTGVGGGIIVNGQIDSGANGTAAEIGHMTVVPHGGAPCNCGKTGCLETEASATGIVRKVREAVSDFPTSSLMDKIQDESITSKDVFDAGKQGDQLAKSVLNDVIDTLGLAIANLAIAINPEKIVIGGGVSNAGDQLLHPLMETFYKYALPRTAEACNFGMAKLGNDAGVIGGAYLVKQNQK